MSSVITVQRGSGGSVHKHTAALFGPDAAPNQIQKAERFLKEHVQDGTLS